MGAATIRSGLKEQMIFPEINYDMVEQVHGLDVTCVTTATRDDRALALLRELGLPFRSLSARADLASGHRVRPRRAHDDQRLTSFTTRLQWLGRQ